MTQQACKKCNGTGSIPCPRCGGEGVIKDPQNRFNMRREPKRCPRCKGSGQLPCPKCGGIEDTERAADIP